MRQGWLCTFCLCGLGVSLNLPKPVPSAHEKSVSTRCEVVTQAPRLPHRLCSVLLLPVYLPVHCVLGLYITFTQVYESKLADQYFQRTLLKKVWRGWRAVVQKQWKEVVERACQARAEEVCVQISNDYEAKVALVDIFCFIFSFLSKN